MHPVSWLAATVVVACALLLLRARPVPGEHALPAEDGFPGSRASQEFRPRAQPRAEEFRPRALPWSEEDDLLEAARRLDSAAVVVRDARGGQRRTTLTSLPSTGGEDLPAPGSDSSGTAVTRVPEVETQGTVPGGPKPHEANPGRTNSDQTNSGETNSGETNSDRQPAPWARPRPTADVAPSPTLWRLRSTFEGGGSRWTRECEVRRITANHLLTWSDCLVSRPVSGVAPIWARKLELLQVPNGTPVRASWKELFVPEASFVSQKPGREAGLIVLSVPLNLERR